MALKLNIGTKDGKAHKKDLSDDEGKPLLGKKLGDRFQGSIIGLSGYEFEITGGSDSAGFPMRWDVSGTGRKKVLLTKGIGFNTKKKGERRRRTIAGNTVSRNTVQLNLKVLKEGKDPLTAPAAAPAEGGDDVSEKQKPAEEKPEEAPKEETEDKPEEKSEEAEAEKEPAEASEEESKSDDSESSETDEADSDKKPAEKKE